MEVEYPFRNLFGLPLPKPTISVCIVVPVCNEEEHLYNTLEALRLQFDCDRLRFSYDRYEILVLVNNSEDRSHQIALNYQKEYPELNLIIANITLKGEEANIGTVRRILMEEAYRRLTMFKDDGIIASIDGDTKADEHWLHFILHEIGLGNDAVGGQILTTDNAGTAHLHHLRDITYRCLLTQAESVLDPIPNDPLPRHFQYFGANMAVTCNMYRKVGGVPRVDCLEDMAFHKALLRHDAKVRRSFLVKVYTSARQEGRVSIGFSEQLRKWSNEEEANIPQMVEHVDWSLSIYKVRGRARSYWIHGKEDNNVDDRLLNDIANELLLDIETLTPLLKNAVYFGEFWDNASYKLMEAAYDLQAITDAIDQLRDFTKQADVNFSIKDSAVEYLRVG